MSNKSTININGKSYTGNSIIVSNGKIIIDGHDATPDSKHIQISVEGSIEYIQADSCESIVVTGEVSGSVQTLSGNVAITGNVSGSVKTMSGDVACHDVTGSVKTMSGDIRHNK